MNFNHAFALTHHIMPQERAINNWAESRVKSFRKNVIYNLKPIRFQNAM
jgi:hypothetical protein